jgi:hypothetical protein
VIIIFGSNATLNAGQMGRFFNGDGSKGKTSLEIHGITLKNGKVDTNVRDSEAAPRNFLETSTYIPGGPHGTTFDRLLHAQLCLDFGENWFNSTG